MPPLPNDPGFLLLVALCAFTGLMRLVELAVSVRRMRARPADVVEEPALFPLMALLHAGLVVAPPLEVWWLGRPFSLTVALASGLVLLLATALRVWTLGSIGKSWNVRVVRPPEDGVSVAGPYAWIRHPNYLVVILEIAAIPAVHGAWLSVAGLSALNALVLWRRIGTEEAALLQVPAWRAAFANKARFIPGVF